MLSKKWNLKSGEVYDQSYAARFLRENVGEILARMVKERQSQGKLPPNLSIDETPNRQTLIVHVTIEIKD